MGKHLKIYYSIEMLKGAQKLLHKTNVCIRILTQTITDKLTLEISVESSSHVQLYTSSNVHIYKKCMIIYRLRKV